MQIRLVACVAVGVVSGNSPSREAPSDGNSLDSAESRCGSENLATGGEGIRTLDLRIANATLSQLSYAPRVSYLVADP